MKLFFKLTRILTIVALFGALNANAFSEGSDYIKLEKPLLSEH